MQAKISAQNSQVNIETDDVAPELTEQKFKKSINSL